MQIIKQIDKKRGEKVLLKGCSRQDLPRLFVDLGYQIGAEIGVEKGAYTEKLCQVGLNIYAIDPWEVSEDYNHPKGQARLDFLYGHTQRVLASYKNVTIIRKTSMEAVKDFKDNSIDFVYIDGCHRFKYIAEDIYEWAKKVRKGGIVSGHDYVQSSGWDAIHVRHVVNAYTKAFHIENWYLTDRLPGQSGDQYTQSWLWIKE